MKVALPDNQLGSRIVLTTRKEDVTCFSSGVTSHILHVQPLKENEAWDLFCRKAFSSNPNQSCPNDLEELALELVGKCKGLPLAIVALGGLMFSKKSKTEWRTVCDSLNWQLSNNPMLEAVKSILLLSFNDLPYPLKHCFLYCCLFPKDTRIRRKKLIKLWIAEGFIHQVGGITSAEVAESYLMELIARNLLQVALRNESGRPKACKMHDLLRELALSISEKEKFCIVEDGRVVNEECKVRRLSIQSTNSYLKSFTGMYRLRSLFVFASNTVSLSNSLLSKFKLLMVLDLQDSAIDKLPDGLGTLCNLRYLNLRRTRVSELPKSIRNLHHLETLDIKGTLIKELPDGVAELQNLRYLHMYHHNPILCTHFLYLSGMRVPFAINRLKKLQVISYIEAQGDIIKQLGYMTKLNRLGLSNVRDADELDLCSSISNLKQLCYLSLLVNNEDESLRLDALKSPPPKLQKLILVGKLERVPHWFSSLQYLTCLYLHCSGLKEDLLPHIESLPNLGSLELVNAFIGKELHFCRGFAKLRFLWLFNLPQLTVITIEKGVMPNMKEFFIDSCFALNALPAGIEFLIDIQTLILSSCSSSLIASIEHMNGKDFSKVQHIPNIRIF